MSRLWPASFGWPTTTASLMPSISRRVVSISETSTLKPRIFTSKSRRPMCRTAVARPLAEIAGHVNTRIVAGDSSRTNAGVCPIGIAPVAGREIAALHDDLADLPVRHVLARSRRAAAPSCPGADSRSGTLCPAIGSPCGITFQHTSHALGGPERMHEHRSAAESAD